MLSESPTRHGSVAPWSASSPSREPGVAPAWLKRIAFISTTRADAGIYAPLIEAVAAREAWEPVLLAGGTHQSAEHGLTQNEIRVPKRARLIPVDHFIPGDDPIAVACNTGAAIGSFAEAIGRLRPDLVFVLGDRAEMLAAALAATLCGTVIAHLHGGDVTRGAYDDACRHAITKLAHLHFPALPEHAARIASMGEAPWRVLPTGALAVDALATFQPIERDRLEGVLPPRDHRPLLVFLFHPQTVNAPPAAQQIAEALAGVSHWDGPMLLIGPNADVGHGAVRSAMEAFVANRPTARLVASLPQAVFWSALAHATVLVGNSSAALLEAPSLHLPAVNIGDRQAGRYRAANVIDVPCDRAAVAAAVQYASTEAFRVQTRQVVNPYGDGHAAERILAVLDRLPARERLLVKS